MKETLTVRFWSKVFKLGLAEGSCWVWQGCKTKQGYGKIHVSIKDGPRAKDGRSGRKMVFAHRLSWEMANGQIPEGLDVLHDCPGGDNPSCVNPAHLKVGTHGDNMADASFKGQIPRGENRPTAKLTDGLVLLIRERYAAGGITQKELAGEYLVSISQINSVVNRRAWRHVT